MLFFVIFFTVYALFHAYAFLKTGSAFSFDLKTGVPLIVFMAVMLFCPALIHYTEEAGLEMLARTLSYVGYLWMGFLILFISASFFIDIYRLAMYLAGLLLRHNLSFISPAARVSFYISILFASIISLYGYFEAKDLRTEHVVIKTSKIPQETGTIKIAQVSDVHIGLIFRKERLKKLMNEVKKAGPDILVSTGDLVDGQINRLEGLAEILSEVKPAYGKFAVTGNHEFYAGIEQALDFTKRAGFTVLRGTSTDAAGVINIAGVDDRAGKPYGHYTEIEENRLLSGLDHNKFTLLLKHRPLVDKNALGLFDLQLSGHTHKGQMFPFNLITKMYYTIDSGYVSLLKGSHLYISRGAGTWGPPIRFLSPPEVTVIELVHEERVQ